MAGTLTAAALAELPQVACVELPAAGLTAHVRVLPASVFEALAELDAQTPADRNRQLLALMLCDTEGAPVLNNGQAMLIERLAYGDQLALLNAGLAINGLAVDEDERPN